MRPQLSLQRENGLAKEVAALSGQNPYACYQCGKCTAGCPFSFGPQQVVRHLQLGQAAAALELETTWGCAGCYTCMAACPKGVDPVRIIRALRTVDKSHGKSLQSRLFAYNHRLAPLGSKFAPFSNLLLRLPGANLAAHYLLGIHKARSLPRFERRNFPSWFRGHTPLGDGHRGPVLLFHDTFMDYNVPQTGIAATELLEKAGFQVELTDTVCCGRPMISKGFMSEAAVQAKTNVARLYERARQGVFIVGCEPSCLLTLRDEYPELVQDPELKKQARVVAKHALLIDEFLAMLNANEELELTFNQTQNGGKQVLFHGHCHQKALADPAKSLELLRLAGYQAEMANAVCCGMAGAFGYEKKHYEASMAAFNRDLFPALRAQPEAEVVVMGISCRQQIEHFAGRNPRHLAQALRDAVE